ncbi:MAG: septum formation initiator family protein [Gemmatimonadota bacterium]|nr:septum formation initiator family protein [Gemmatimonadota bacterium]
MRFYRVKRDFLNAPRRRMYRFLWVLPALWFVYLFLAGDSGYLRIRERSMQIEAMRRENETERTQNLQLEAEVELLKNDLAIIEKIAREQYGMVKENETVYMVYPATPDPTSVTGK